MHKCMIKNICSLCSKEECCILGSCGCFYCVNCYNDLKYYIYEEKSKCIICDYPIDYSKSINMNSTDIVPIVSKLDISNTAKRRIIDMLKVYLLLQIK